MESQMAVSDQKFLPTSPVVVQTVDVALDAIVATGQTSRIIRAFKPGHEFYLLAPEVFARVVAAVISFDVAVLQEAGSLASGSGSFTHGSGGTPIVFTTPDIYYRIGDAVYHKAAVTTQAFTAAHVVTALKWGAIRVQINAAGTISTRVVGSPQAYDSAAAALAACPAAAAGNVSIGVILINAGAGNWTANTDDLTPGSDLAAIQFLPVVPVALGTAALVPVAATSTYGAVPTPRSAAWGDPHSIIVLAYTTDGSGDITDGFFRIRYRPFPLNGEA
jgi:hypothetical protein